MSAESPHSEENEALGSEFCSGYMDIMGKWNNGFYCPGESTEEQYCCGTATFKYCCPQREQVITEDASRLPLLLGVMFGVVAAIIIITVVLCCFCSCCILYKKRQPRLNGGPLYRMHCSSTASGVANMYSFSNPNSLATTPLDSALVNSRLLVDLEPAHSMSPNESRTTMARGHTFSRDTRSTEMDLHTSELGELNDRVPGTGTDILSPEPPPPYNSSVDEQHPDRTVQVLSHGRSFSQQSFNPAEPLHSSTSLGLRPSPSLVTESSCSGATQLETPVLPSSRTFTGTGAPLATCITFIPAHPVSEQITASTSVAAEAGVGPVLLPGSTTPLVTTIGSRGQDALYHSTKF